MSKDPLEQVKSREAELTEELEVARKKLAAKIEQLKADQEQRLKELPQELSGARKKIEHDYRQQLEKKIRQLKNEQEQEMLKLKQISPKTISQLADLIAGKIK